MQSGIGGFLLKPWNERSRTQMEILPEVQAKLESISGLQDFRLQPALLAGHGRGSAVPVRHQHGQRLRVAAASGRPGEKNARWSLGKFAFVDVDLAFDKPEVVVDIDRAKAAQMGVSMQDLGGTLATLLGEAEINRFTVDGRSYKVIAQVERPFRDNPDWLNNYYVKNTQGELLALSTLITVSDRARPRQLNQFQQLNSAILSGVPLVSMGEAIDAVRQIAREEAPAGFAFDYAGASRQYVQEGSALWVTFGLALAIIFLVLAAQFESFRDPLVILVTVLAVDLRRLAAAVPRLVEHEHLYPGRVGDVDRPDQQARHPDRRIRQPAAQGQGPDAARGGGGSRGHSPCVRY